MQKSKEQSDMKPNRSSVNQLHCHERWTDTRDDDN